jgi:hypothetical protein
MALINGTTYQTTSPTGDNSYNNKLSLELMYLVRGGPSFGARYILESRNENESQIGQAYGPMAGYYAENGFFAVFTYDIYAKLGSWVNGEGFEACAGHMEHIGDQLHLGLKYSVRKIRYKTDLSSNISVSKDVHDQFPSISLMYLF